MFCQSYFYSNFVEVNLKTCCIPNYALSFRGCQELTNLILVFKVPLTRKCEHFFMSLSDAENILDFKNVVFFFNLRGKSVLFGGFYGGWSFEKSLGRVTCCVGLTN